MTQLAPEPTINTSDDEGMFHWYCCDEDRALCGKNISDHSISHPTDEDLVCLVCDHLADMECEVCGE